MAVRVQVKFLFMFIVAFVACRTAGDHSLVKRAGDNTPAEAFDPATVIFGPELEFAKPDGTETEDKLVGTYLAKVAEMCAADKSVSCSRQVNRYTIETVDKRSKIRVFPYIDSNVLEIPLDPMTIEQTRQALPLIQKYVFDATAAMGLVAGTNDINRWSSHMNVSWPGLRADGVSDLFMRYFVDYQNRPELAMGVLGGDIRNGPPMAIFSSLVQDSMKNIVAQYNQDPTQFKSTAALAQKIIDETYTEKFEFSYFLRYQAINLMPLTSKTRSTYDAPSSQRLELRAFYMPQRAEQLLADYSVIAGRLSYLSKQTTPIIYQPPALTKPATFHAAGMQEGITVDRAVQAYATYLSEAGLDLEYQAQNLINPEMRSAMLTYLQAHPDGNASPATSEAIDRSADADATDQAASPEARSGQNGSTGKR